MIRRRIGPQVKPLNRSFDCFCTSPLNFGGLLRRGVMKSFEFQRPEKSPGTAAILSFFFIGLGQAYNGEKAKALVFLFLYALSIFLTLFMIGFITTPLLWIWSMADAYRSSRKMNQAGAPRQPLSKALASTLVMNVYEMN